jgi:RNA polymerase sigma-70 factor, ECF subfamily
MFFEMAKDYKENAEEIEVLVLKAQKGNQEAFAELYDVFIDPIYRYVYYRVNQADVEDVVENIFLKIWENVRKYRRQKNTRFSSWIFRIAHNMVIDYYRSNKVHEYDELDLNLVDHNREHNPIRKTQDSLNQRDLKAALTKVKKQYRDILIYKFINEFSNKEISQILKKSEGSLRILQFRALRALKKELIEMGISYKF